MKKIILIPILLILSALAVYASDNSSISIADLFVSPRIIEGDYAQPGDMLAVNVYLKELDHDFDNTQIMAYVDDMRVYDTKGPFEISGSNRDQMIYLQIPPDAKKGVHYLRLIVFNEIGWRVIYRDFYII